MCTVCKAIVERVKRSGKSINKRGRTDVVLYDVIFYFLFSKRSRPRSNENSTIKKKKKKYCYDVIFIAISYEHKETLHRSINF